MSKYIYLIFFMLMVASCVPQKRLEYVQTDKNSPEKYDLVTPSEKAIEPGDYLTIKVESPDEKNFLGTTGSSSSSMGTNDIMLVQNAYLVDSIGKINIPVIGKIDIKGLTLNECSDKLQEIITSYISNPTVNVR